MDAPAAADELARYLNWYFERHPVHADALGVAGYSAWLGDFTAAAFEDQERGNAHWLSRLLSAEAAQPAGRIDRDLAISALRGDVLLADWPVWRRDPSLYLGPVFAGLMLPFLHRLAPEAELVDGVVARLGEVPAVLASCRNNLDVELASPLLVRRALGQARTGADFLRTALPAEVVDETSRARLVEATGPAIEAFETTTEHLADLVERAAGDWRMGERLYSALLQQRELLGYDAAELRRRGEAAWAALEGQLRELAPAVPGGSADWRATMAGLQDEHPPTLEAMRAEYEAETARARAFLAEHELVTFPEGERCEVLPAPAYQRPILAVASYLQPPALTSARIGHFFVPFTPDNATDEEVDQRLRTNARAQLPTVSVHETYPGHHWQLSWAAGRNAPIRSVHRSAYFAEGWALYAEAMMREYGYFAEPAHELAHLDARVFRAARIMVDTELHCGRMDPEDAEEFMVARASLSPGTAREEVKRYCAWPTQAPSYLTGALEIEQLRQEWTAADRGGLRAFHDTLAGTGCLPLGLARDALLE